MRWALVFSGQGMQHASMLPWLQHGTLLSAVEQQLGADWRQRLAEPAWAGNNAHAQCLLTGLGLAAWAELSTLLSPSLPPPAIVAGYSVGEMAAFSAAGVFSAEAALALASQRAACMDDAAAQADADAGCDGSTGLMAVTGAPHAIEALQQRFGLALAIRNAADSVVLGGWRQALASAAEAAPVQGSRCTPLNVAMASHTRWMAPAAAAFAQHLAGHAFAMPQRLLVSNVRGRIRTAEQAREALAAQIASTVRWDECIEAIAAQQVQAVLEIGPGQSLAKMWQQAHADVPARSADEFRSAAAVAAWLRKAVERGA